LGRQGIEPFLQQYLKVRDGIALFLAEPNASVLEDPHTHPHGWLQVLNEDEVTRSILHYELAAIFFRPEHRVLLESAPAEEPAEGAAPLSIAPAPGPLEPKRPENPATDASLEVPAHRRPQGPTAEPMVEAPHGPIGESAGRRRARARPSFGGRKGGKIKSRKIPPRPASHHAGASHPSSSHSARSRGKRH
jgi:hypothetical protein